MDIFAPNNYKGPRVGFDASLEVQDVDLRDLSDFADEVVAIEDKKLDTIQSNYDNILKVQQDVTGIKLNSAYGRKILEQKKDSLNVNEDLYNLSIEDLRNPFATKKVQDTLNKLITDPEVTGLLQEQKIFEDLQRKVGRLERKDPTMASVFKDQLNRVATDSSGSLSVLDIDPNDFQRIDFNELMMSKLNELPAGFSVRTSADGSMEIYNPATDVVITQEEFAVGVAEEFSDSPLVANNLRAQVDPNKPEGERTIEDPDAITAFLEESARKVFKRYGQTKATAGSTKATARKATKYDPSSGDLSGSTVRFINVMSEEMPDHTFKTKTDIQRLNTFMNNSDFSVVRRYDKETDTHSIEFQPLKPTLEIPEPIVLEKIQTNSTSEPEGTTTTTNTTTTPESSNGSDESGEWDSYFGRSVESNTSAEGQENSNTLQTSSNTSADGEINSADGGVQVSESRSKYIKELGDIDNEIKKVEAQIEEVRSRNNKFGDESVDRANKNELQRYSKRLEALNKDAERLNNVEASRVLKVETDSTAINNAIEEISNLEPLEEIELTGFKGAFTVKVSNTTPPEYRLQSKYGKTEGVSIEELRDFLIDRKDLDPSEYISPESSETKDESVNPESSESKKKVKQGETYKFGDTTVRITDPYGMRKLPGRGRRHSTGIDFATDTGKVVALADGVIREVKLQGSGEKITPDKGAAAGYYVVVDQADGSTAQYMHLDPMTEEEMKDLKGKKISKGEEFWGYSEGSGSMTKRNGVWGVHVKYKMYDEGDFESRTHTDPSVLFD